MNDATAFSDSICAECGARYTDAADSCDARFNQLLALDHSRREPWGSRHGQAFSAYALQHPVQHARSVDRAWNALYRIYRTGESPASVYGGFRDGMPKLDGVPPRASQPVGRPSVTIADLGQFGEETYAERLDDWCRAALVTWDATDPRLTP